MSLNLRLLTPAFLIILACTPKAEDTADEGDASSAGDETNGGSSDTEAVTTGDSDPTMPGTATNVTNASGMDSSASDTTPGTSAGTTPDPTGSDEATSAGTVTTVGTDASASDSDTDDTSDPPPPVPCEGDPEPIVAETIMAYTQAQIPPDPNPTTDTITSTTNGEPIPADTLYIKFSDQQYTCADPNAILECGPHWDFTIIIPADFQFPGVYNLAGNGPFATVSETSEGMGNDCAGGGGGGFSGTFELINITDVTVEGRLCGIDAFFTFSDPNLNGSFVAERCE